MKEICLYVNRSEATVVRWIKELAFPASKINGGTWESDRGLIDGWRKKAISVTAEPVAPHGTAPTHAKKKRAGGKKRLK
jgi:hypothetical protein